MKNTEASEPGNIFFEPINYGPEVLLEHLINILNNSVLKGNRIQKIVYIEDGINQFIYIYRYI